MIQKKKERKKFNQGEKKIKYIQAHYNEFNNYYMKKKAFEIEIDFEKINRNQTKKVNTFDIEKDKITNIKENQILTQEIKNSIENDSVNGKLQIKENENEYENKNKLKYTIKKNIKILLLGEHFSGKTSIIQRLISNKIINEYNTTIKIKNFKCPLFDYNNNFVELTFIDTPPIDQIKNKIKVLLYDNIDIILFVFDITNKGSFQRLIKHINEIEFNENIIIGIIANKQDICPEYIKYRIHELIDYCYENNFSFLVISVLKDTENIFDFLNIILSKKIFQNK